MCEFVGGAYIYAECVKTGLGKLVWDSHPVQETNKGNFIFLQLAMAGKFDFTCEPKMMFVKGCSASEAAGMQTATAMR